MVTSSLGLVSMIIQATAKGHLDQDRQGLQSTQEAHEDYFPPQEKLKTHHVAIKIETPSHSI